MTQYQRIKDLRASGMSVKDIMAEIGVEKSAVYWSLRYTPKIRSQHEARERYRFIAADYASGMTIKELMEKYEASKEVIHLARRKCGVPNRRTK